MTKKITREDETALPRFNSHREARLYFKIRFGDAFEIDDSFVIREGEKTSVLYRYNLILDRKVYKEGLQKLLQGTLSDADDFLASYQTIEIKLDGSVHVVH